MQWKQIIVDILDSFTSNNSVLTRDIKTLIMYKIAVVMLVPIILIAFNSMDSSDDTELLKADLHQSSEVGLQYTDRCKTESIFKNQNNSQLAVIDSVFIENRQDEVS